MKLPTCLWMLGAGVFLSITSTHAQRSENIIDLNAEFNENGDLVVNADKKWIGTFSLAIDFVNATNLAVPPTLSNSNTFQRSCDYVEKQRIIYLYPVWVEMYVFFGRLACKT